ncbi:MAG: hypothetical protein WBP95_20990 [Acidobacteriaceae bacterium]
MNGAPEIATGTVTDAAVDSEDGVEFPLSALRDAVAGSSYHKVDALARG